MSLVVHWQPKRYRSTARVLRKRLPHEIGSDQSPWKPGGIAYRHFDGSKGFEDY